MSKATMLQLPTNGNQTNAYFSPAESGEGPGVIVLQEWWGLVDHIKEVCDRFAKAGFSALAPDLYRGDKADGPDEAGRLMMALNIEQTGRDLMASVDWLSEQTAVTPKDKIGVVGFCMGGQLALYAGTLNKKVAAVADFYGIHPNVNPDFSEMKASVLGIFGKKDEMVSPDKVKDLEGQLNSAGVDYDFHSFDADHAFFNNTRPEVFNESAAQQAWKLTTEHFKKNLRG